VRSNIPPKPLRSRPNITRTTTLGSIALARDVAAFPAPAYKISKAALNALTVQYAIEYEDEGFTFMALCPGVSTFLSVCC
jgi:NAD(P)-dependent dehydrogenase (short-subunit alcohol dehydrogenase family)